MVTISKAGNASMIVLTLIFIMIVVMPGAVFAARPLISDDAGTMGRGKFQVELGFEASDHRTDDDGVVSKEDETSGTATIYYGIVDNIDIVLGLPYQKTKIREDGETVQNENGFSDMTFDVKWRFFEKDGYAMALKPGLSFPTGNDEKGLGSGRIGYGAIFIATKELEPFAFHFNAGYKRNENKTDERKDIWGVDLAGEVRVAKPLRFVANMGMVTNTDRQSSTSPAFFLGGLIYTVTDNFDLDLGYKRGLNKAAADNTYILGLTMKF